MSAVDASGDPVHAVCSAMDSLNLAQELDTGNETTLRQFACPKRQRSWRTKVLKKKEISKCNHCRNKYEPIPKDKEWGYGKFICKCKNKFTGYGEMNVTKSECYKCRTPVPIHHMVPPRWYRKKKTKASHSCNGVNCIWRRSSKIPDVKSESDKNLDNNDETANGQCKPIYTDEYEQAGNKEVDDITPAVPLCIHPMAKSKIRTFSSPHISTEQIVTIFLSQGSRE